MTKRELDLFLNGVRRAYIKVAERDGIVLRLLKVTGERERHALCVELEQMTAGMRPKYFSILVTYKAMKDALEIENVSRSTGYALYHKVLRELGRGGLSA